MPQVQQVQQFRSYWFMITVTNFVSCCDSLRPLQVTTAPSACGIWRVKPASRSSRLTGKSSRRQSTTWRFTRQSATLPAPGQMRSPKCLYDAELRLPLQPRTRTQPPTVGDPQGHRRGRTFRHGSSAASHSRLVSCRTGRLYSRHSQTGLDS